MKFYSHVNGWIVHLKEMRKIYWTSAARAGMKDMKRIIYRIVK